MGGPAEWAQPKQPHGNAPILEERSPRGRFPKDARLRSRSDFSRAKSSSERVVTRHFVFLLSPQNPPQTRARLGVTASRKVGTAVVRNRAKRLVREAFRATSESLWSPGLDVIVVVRNVPPDARLQDVIAEWESARGKVLSRAKAFASASSTPARDATRATPQPTTSSSAVREAHTPHRDGSS